MKKIWIVVSLGCAAGVALLNPRSEGTPSARPVQRSRLVLTGRLAPVVSAIIPARDVRLEVPMYSRVFKGQVVGEGLQRPLVAPLDGMLVPVGALGEVGVAADPNAVCVHAAIPAYEIDEVKVGESAEVKLDGTSAVMSARVSEISSNPVEFRGRSVYPMTLSLSSPVLPGNSSVHLYLGPQTTRVR